MLTFESYIYIIYWSGGLGMGGGGGKGRTFDHHCRNRDKAFANEKFSHYQAFDHFSNAQDLPGGMLVVGIKSHITH